MTLWLFIFAVAWHFSYVQSACPSGWTASNSIPGKCYKLQPNATFLIDIWSECRKLHKGADILSIANGFENTEVANLAKNAGIHEFFIGYVYNGQGTGWLTWGTNNVSYSNMRKPATLNCTDLNDGKFCNFATTVNSSDLLWSSRYGLAEQFPGACEFYPNSSAHYPPDPTPDCPKGWSSSLVTPGKCLRILQKSSSDTFYTFWQSIVKCRDLETSAEVWAPESWREMVEVYAGQTGTPKPDVAPGFKTNFGNFDGKTWTALGRHPNNYTNWMDGKPEDDPDYSFVTTLFFVGMQIYAADMEDFADGIEPTMCQYYPADQNLTQKQPPCPSGWEKGVVHPNKCYKMLDKVYNYTDAHAACQKLDPRADMLAISSYQENGETHERAGFEELFWIALDSLESNGTTWKWSSPAGNPNVTRWQDGQPENDKYPDALCTIMIPDNERWYSFQCEDWASALCQLILD